MKVFSKCLVKFAHFILSSIALAPGWSGAAEFSAGMCMMGCALV
jgi:hypothetical protein